MRRVPLRALRVAPRAQRTIALPWHCPIAATIRKSSAKMASKNCAAWASLLRIGANRNGPPTTAVDPPSTKAASDVPSLLACRAACAGIMGASAKR